jgi:hypothetical protein
MGLKPNFEFIDNAAVRAEALTCQLCPFKTSTQSEVLREVIKALGGLSFDVRI